MFLVVVSLVTAPVTAAEEVLTWLLHRPLQEAQRGRYNARDLSVVVASSSSSFYDPYQNLVSQSLSLLSTVIVYTKCSMKYHSRYNSYA